MDDRAESRASHLPYPWPLLIVALWWLLVTPGQPLAQIGGQDAACSNAKSTAAMRECEIGRFRRADAGMNRAYLSLNARLDQRGRAKLRAAQQAWIRFRDAEADYQADAERGGTLALLIATSVRADLTEARSRDLEKAVKALK